MSGVCFPEIMVAMRDGIRLATDVYLPSDSGKFPVIVIRSPYSSVDGHGLDHYALDFCKEGVGMVVQDVRGTGMSEGEADLWAQEKNDAEDLFQWISLQKWFNGNLVTNGESYPGCCQWQAARTLHPAMKCLTPHNAPLDPYHAAYYVSGVYSFGIGVSWAAGVLARRKRMAAPPPLAGKYKLLPLRQLPELAGYPEWPLYKKWIDHPLFDACWRAMDAFADIPKIRIPAFITGGWFDPFLMQTLHAFTAMRTSAASEKARKFTRLVMEPFDHDGRTGEPDYGPNHTAGVIELRNRFMCGILRNPDADPLPDFPAVRLFVMGSNRWIDAEEWPLPVKETKLYLMSDAPANTAGGAGRLGLEPPENTGFEDVFTADPANPVPTAGGNNLGYFPAGQHDQKDVERRADVLVYTSAVLERDTDVIGYVRAVLYASTSAPDADFTVKLCDVTPEGISYNVCDGLVRASRSGASGAETVPPAPGEIRKYEIDCWATCITFRAGHRFRVEVSWSNFPRFSRALNTGNPPGTDSEMRVAVQRILHDAEHPSHLVLPVYTGKN